MLPIKQGLTMSSIPARQGADASACAEAAVAGRSGLAKRGNRLALLAALLLLAPLAGGQALAQNSDGQSLDGTKLPPLPAASPSVPPNLLGSYMAARYAKNRNDTSVAARYYYNALQFDPNNMRLMLPAVSMLASDGNWDEAVPLARRVIVKRKSNRVANLIVGLYEAKNGEFLAAGRHFKAASANPIGKLTGTLARSWARLARGNGISGIKLLSSLRKADGGRFHFNYHTGLIADLAGRPKTAGAAFKRVLKQEPGSLRVALAYARHAAHWGDTALARRILKGYMKRANTDGRLLAGTLLREIDANKKVALLVTTPRDGLAEVFYGLGEALIGVGAVSDGMVYLQMALYMKPDLDFALEALANVYESTGKNERALATYDLISNESPLQSSIAIRKADNYNRLDRIEEALEILKAQAAREPKSLRPVAALGDILRSRKRYAEAIDYYDKVIELIPNAEAKHWSFFFSRGTCYERIKNWPMAEADLKKALGLSPNRAEVLNYLGYSWVDQMLNLKEGMRLIEKAVRLKPGDGYIVDSLGWAHYRLKNYHKAVEFLNRAVELRPEDPTLNDHLGDALWRTGRQLEARYQWEQALSLKPEEAEEKNIRKKLLFGLPPRKQAQAEPAAGQPK